MTTLTLGPLARPQSLHLWFLERAPGSASLKLAHRQATAGNGAQRPLDPGRYFGGVSGGEALSDGEALPGAWPGAVAAVLFLTGSGGFLSRSSSGRKMAAYL